MMQPSIIRPILLAAWLLAAAPPLAAAGPLHHDMDLRIDLAGGSLQAVDRIDLAGKTHLVLELAPGLELAGALLDGAPVEAVDAEGGLRIDLPDAEPHRLELRYGGAIRPPSDEAGLAPVLGPEGAFLPYGIGWLATAPGEDFVTYRLTVETLAPFKAVAIGRLASESEADGRYRAVFEAIRPSEPPSVFAGTYQVDERMHGEIRLRTYFPPEQASLAPLYLDQAAGYIDRFAAEIGGYPHDGFAMIAAALPVGLGFPGATYVAAQILRMPFMQTRSLAHEILHNWWANGVFIDPAEGNWAEGLTTYMADYSLAADAGEDAAMRLAWLRDYAALPASRDQPVSTFRSKGHNADQVVGYNKTAMVFHMLRSEIGDDAFAAGIQDFWQAHRFGFAGWSDLQASFERAAGRDLAGFFGQWLEREGAARLHLGDVRSTGDDGRFELAFDLRQDSPVYALQVPIRIRTEADEVARTIALDREETSARVELEARPLAIAIDPEQDLFRRLAPGEAPPILRDVTLDPAAVTLILDDGEPGTIARDLAARMLDTKTREVALDDPDLAASPVMVVGTDEAMPAALARLGLEMPETLAGRGSARCWIGTREGAPPVLAVMAQDAESLAALLRPLPHYGRASYLVFDGAKAIDNGVWPAGDSTLVRTID